MILQRLRCLSAAALALTLMSQHALPATWQEDGDMFSAVLKSAQRDRWEEAAQLAGEISRPAARTVVEWLRLREGSDSLQDYFDFLERHGDWPGLKILRQSGEAAMTPQSDPLSVVDYFTSQPPQTGNGAIRLAEALRSLGLRHDAELAITDGWKSLPFSGEQQAEALELFGDALAPMHAVRLDNLLWAKRYDEAERLWPILGEDWKRLAEARISLQKRANGVDSRIRRIPANLLGDPGLTFDRIVWRLRDGAEDSALSLLLQSSTSHADLANPERWAPRRLSVARWLMREGRYEEAYRTASRHHLTDRGRLPQLLTVSAAHREAAERTQIRNYADLEWLCGYLSLRFLDDPTSAVHHFRAFRRTVDTPISNGRAGYWLGLALEADRQSGRAVEAYALAAREQTTFYGQLAAERLGAVTDSRLAAPAAAAERNVEKMQRLPVVQAGLLYRHSGNHSHAAWFLAHVAETLNEADSSALAALALAHDTPFSAVKVAKEGVKNGYLDAAHLFPVVELAGSELPVPTEVALAVARQETEFRDTAVSSAGAVGLMQIKPSTGAELAERIGLAGRIEQLLRERENNVVLGATYLSDRMNDYDGSYIMTFAAYNAGPGRLSDWLPVIGDPRTGDIDPVDWIEHLPYGETRNYVMRVMEAVTVYRMRLNGSTQPISLLNDLARGLPGQTQRAGAAE